MSSRNRAAVVFVLLSCACSACSAGSRGAGSRGAGSRGAGAEQSSRAETPPALVSRPVPARGNPRRAPVEKEKRALPPLCGADERACEEFAPVLFALARGEAEEAGRLLAETTLPEALEARAVHLLLKGRCRLESDSLEYGMGGEASEEALVLFRAAEEGLQNKDLARLQIARAQLSLGQGDQAVAALISLAERYQGDAEVQAALGIAYISTGRAARALSPLRLAAKLDPTEPERLVVLGTTHMLLGDLVEAERQFRGAIELAPNSARAKGDLGAVLLLQGRIPEGKAHLLGAATLAPERATYAANLSYAELLSKAPTLGEKWARKAIELDPELASGWLNLGLSQVALGKRKEARESFEKAGALDPTDPRASNNLRDLDELEGKSTPEKSPSD